MSRSSFLLLAAFAACLVITASADETCSADEGPITCESCREGADVNAVAGLPRVNRAGAFVSSNMGAYDWVKCDENDECTYFWDDDVAKQMEGDPEERSPASYFQGVGAYIAFSIFMAFLSFFCFTCCCLWRMCGCCGGWTPQNQIKTSGSRRCCGCGFERKLDPLLTGGDKFGYPTTQSLLVRLLMIVACLLIFIFIGVGQQMGNVAMTESMKRLADAPDSTVQTVRKMIRPGHDLIVDIASHTIVPTIEDINATMLDAISLDELTTAADCIVEKAIVPPELDELIQKIRDIVNLKTKVAEVAPDVEDVIDSVNTATTTISSSSSDLTELLDDLSASKLNLTTKLGQLEVSLNVMSDAINSMNKRSTGIDSVRYDITNASAAANYPTTEMDAAANGAAGSASLEELMRTSPPSVMVGVENSAARDQLITDLNAINAEFAALPNTTLTWLNVKGFVRLRNELIANDTIGELDRLLQSVEEDVARVPGSAAANTPINAILDALFDLNGTKIREIVIDLNATIQTIPSRDVLERLIDGVFKLADLIPCADNVIPSIDRVDEILIKLPDFVEDVKNITKLVKEQIENARNMTDDVLDQLEVVEEKKALFDLDEILRLVGEIESVQVSANASFVDILSSTKALDDSKTFDLSGIRSQLSNTETTVNNPNVVPSSELLDKLVDAEDGRISITTLIADVVASIQTFAQGRCSGTTTSCTNDAPCGGGTCQFAQKQCSDSATVCTGDPGESVCGAGYCLFEKTSYASLQTVLADFTVPTFDANDLLTQLENLSEEISGLDLETPKADVNELKGDLDEVPIDTARTQLNDVESQSSDVSSKFVDVEDGWNGVKSGTEAIPDPDTVNSALDTMKDATDQLIDIRNKTRTFADLLRNTKVFLHDTLPVLFDDLDETKLDATFDTEGILGTFNIVIKVAQNITDWLQEQQTLAEQAMSDDSSPMNLTQTLSDLGDDLRPRLRVLSEDQFFDNGPYYFIASIMEEDIVEWDDPKADRVFKNADGEDYPDDKMCLTTTCINNEVNFVNRQPLSTVMKEHGTDMPIPFNREQMTGLPFIFPALAAILGLLSAVLPCPKNTRWQRGTTCLSGCIMCFCIPLAFFFAGSAFFMVMLGADSCRGGANVGYQILNTPDNIESICDSLGSVSTNDPKACNVSVGGDDYVEFSVIDAYSDVLGSCNSATAAWNSALSQISDIYADQPLIQANNTLNDMDDGSFSVRPRLRKNILDGARRFGTAGSNFVDNVNGVLTCSEVNGDFNAFKESVCCDVMTAFYWSIGSWNLIAWIMCCCGIPACCMGYKRFPAQPWGRHWKNAQRAEKAMAQQKAQEEATHLGQGGAILQMVNMPQGPIHGTNPMRHQQPPGAGFPPGITTNNAWAGAGAAPHQYGNPKQRQLV